MGEEQKKPEEKKEEAPNVEKQPPEEGKKEEKKSDESKVEEAAAAPPPQPPQEIVLRVYMHCEGCARKVRRCLKGFEGVEEVTTDCKTSKVVVKGEKADPLGVLERVQRKSHRQVELISPIPSPPPAAEEPKKPEEKVTVNAEEKIEEIPVVTVVLGVHMHCEACAQEIKKRIQRMKGVESAEPNLKSSQVTVKGAFEPEKLRDHVYRRTGKHSTIIKVEPEKKKEEEKVDDCKKEEKKAEEEGDKEAKKATEEVVQGKKEGGDSSATDGSPPVLEVEEPKLEMRRNEFYYYNPHHHQQQQQVYYPQRFVQEYNAYPYPPQIFSDENPNACTVM